MEGANHGWTRYNYSHMVNESLHLLTQIYLLQVNQSVEEYNNSVGLGHVLTPVWTFWNAMFLAVTTYTTIGYGNITAKTKLGKLAAMVYAVVGIPLVLMILHKSGRLFLMGLEHMWDFILRWAWTLFPVIFDGFSESSTVSVWDLVNNGSELPEKTGFPKCPWF